MTCEHEMKTVDITKGGKKVGVNHFCAKNGCNYEYDTNTRRK